MHWDVRAYLCSREHDVHMGIVVRRGTHGATVYPPYCSAIFFRPYLEVNTFIANVARAVNTSGNM
jgi:hypothetical protein